MQCSCCAQDTSNCDSALNFLFPITDGCKTKQTETNTTQCNEQEKGSEKGGISNAHFDAACTFDATAAWYWSFVYASCACANILYVCFALWQIAHQKPAKMKRQSTTHVGDPLICDRGNLLVTIASTLRSLWEQMTTLTRLQLATQARGLHSIVAKRDVCTSHFHVGLQPISA